MMKLQGFLGVPGQLTTQSWFLRRHTNTPAPLSQSPFLQRAAARGSRQVVRAAKLNYIKYTVQDGDTLVNIGNKYNLDWETIQACNSDTKLPNGNYYHPGLREGKKWTIYPGEFLQIPNVKRPNPLLEFGMIGSKYNMSMSTPEAGVQGFGTGKFAPWPVLLPILALLLGVLGYKAITRTSKSGPSLKTSSSRGIASATIQQEGGSATNPEIDQLKNSLSVSSLQQKIQNLDKALPTMNLSSAEKAELLLDLNLSQRDAAAMLPKLKLESSDARTIIQSQKFLPETVAELIPQLGLSPKESAELLLGLNFSLSSLSNIIPSLYKTSPSTIEHFLSSNLLSEADLKVFLPSLNLPNASLRTLLRQRSMSASIFAVILKDMKLSSEELIGLLADQKPKLSSSYLSILLPVLELSPEILASVISTQKLSAVGVVPILKHSKLSPQELSAVIPALDLSSRDLATVLSGLDLPSEDMEIVLVEICTRKNLPANELGMVLSSVKLPAAHFTSMGRKLGISVSDLSEILPAMRYSPVQLGTVLNASTVGGSNLACILEALQLSPADLLSVVGLLKIPSSEAEELRTRCGIPHEDPVMSRPRDRNINKDEETTEMESYVENKSAVELVNQNSVVIKDSDEALTNTELITEVNKTKSDEGYLGATPIFAIMSGLFLLSYYAIV